MSHDAYLGQMEVAQNMLPANDTLAMVMAELRALAAGGRLTASPCWKS